ncbi:MAG: murein biosynthesis integral membrane protein MurJ [Rhizobiales bacterium NRL2]|nr:MAG: murein biosynthesis integral membrane protein MurJ [Rhizobiales bacterium NRL2]
MADSGSGRLMRAAATVGGFTMISRITGFARDILIAAIVGAGPIGDAFFVAFKLPNFFRRLFAEGAFNAAFVPLFSGRLAREGREAARLFAEDTAAVLLTVLFLLVAALQMAMPVAMIALAPGFTDDPATFDLAVELTRITFPYLLFISLVSLFQGVLNSTGRFAAAAATPILLNLCLIAALLLLVEHVPTAGHALAIGVFVAGAVQFLWLLHALHRAGLALRLPRPRLTPGVKRVVSLMAPAALGAGVVQINLVIDIILASTLPEGSISYLFYADRISQLPIGVVGVAVGTALLPLLSRQAASGQLDDARLSLNRAIEFALLLSVPAAAACLMIPSVLVGTLFERGAFSPADTAATAWALSAYAWGLPAYVMVKVLGPAFFAREDTSTPVKIAVAAVAVNVVLNLILMGPMLHAGLALATAIASWLNTALLAYFAWRRGWLKPDRRLLWAIPKMFAAALVMAAGLLFGAIALDVHLPGGEFWRALSLAILVAGAVAVYFGLGWILRLVRPSDLGGLARGR